MGRAELSTRAERGQRIQFKGKWDIFSVGVGGGTWPFCKRWKMHMGYKSINFLTS